MEMGEPRTRCQKGGRALDRIRRGRREPDPRPEGVG